ncbi:uncharacterized protein IUM83_04922 [Phytophthora cinnamomi]|uniref:uncharacterized protein n=1 Tax=Phytophthora cinnamomi TaxID=4785 RepID=UPI0035593A72|nr:hypothetical protein IUM83_04922 [Phytophthora cinnamomi]
MARINCAGYKPDGTRCKIKWGLNDQGYCFHHDWQARPVCQGFSVDNQTRCKNHAKTGYAYCCASHDPAIGLIRSHELDPITPGLRVRVQADVVARYGGTDVYNREWLDLETPFALHLDHIVEKQCFPFMFSQMGLRQGDEDLAMATEVLRENVVHELDNLALTRSNTNRIKGSAVWHFLDDSLTGHRSKTFTDYLSAARRDNESLGRDATRQITRCMGRSMKMCQRKLGDEGETPVLEQLSEHLQQMYVDMELHGAR